MPPPPSPWLAWGYDYCFVFCYVLLLGWLGAIIIVLFFVYVPPLGWLGAIIIVWFFILRAFPWLARGYDYCFVFCLRAPLGWLGVIIIVFLLLSSVCLIFGACVFIFCEVGFDSPTKLGSGDPLVYW